MRIQIIRKDGKIHGLAIVRGQGKVLAAQQGSTYWRICEHCCENEANVFCKTHARFVCVRCLSFHGKQSVGGNFILGYACRLVSLAHYRELAKHIDDEMRVNEPHDEPRGWKQAAPLSPPDGYVEGEDEDCQPSEVGL